MRIKCAWCGRDMGDKPPYDQPHISHEICETCRAMFPRQTTAGEMFDDAVADLAEEKEKGR